VGSTEVKASRPIMADKTEKEESKVEVAKRNSRFLRGTIAETLASDATHFGDDDVHVLKFHGAYQQDDRDVRRQRRAQGLDKAYMFMVRCAIPAGVLTADQYLALSALADQHANGSLRVTTRQGIQFHGVLKENLKATLAQINHSLVTTLSACGDVGRNVMACPAPLADEAHVAVRRIAREIAKKLSPASGAYHEIWLDDEKVVSGKDEEPFYGDTYLPRKFKTGIAVAMEGAMDNCAELYSYDLGLIAILERACLLGYNVLVGGGMGMTHNKADTSARLAQPLGFVGAEHPVETARAVAAVFRDHGNRADRRHARLKYLLADWGMDRFRDELRRRVPFQLSDWHPVPAPTCDDHLGLHRQDERRWFYGVFVENGRIIDTESKRLKSALRQIVTRFRPGVSLTAQQNMLLTDLDEPGIEEVERILADHGVTPAANLPAARRYSMACPALPTCGLAMSDSERVMPSVLDRFEKELISLGMRNEPITLRMTGCPNGCARPYTADVSFVGRRPGVYHVYVGGGLGGDRLADLYAADVPIDDLVAVLRPLLQGWANNRRDGESLGDYYQRLVNRSERRVAVTGKEQPTADTVDRGIDS